MQNPIIFACFQPILTFFPPDLLMKYRIFISIVDISANLENINIDKAILKNIDRAVLENINIDIDIDKEILENIDIDKEISENINIDKISNRLEFGISNRATSTCAVCTSSLLVLSSSVLCWVWNLIFQAV